MSKIRHRQLEYCIPSRVFTQLGFLSDDQLFGLNRRATLSGALSWLALISTV